jgi:hypothetical protein
LGLNWLLTDVFFTAYQKGIVCIIFNKSSSSIYRSPQTRRAKK